MVNRNIHSMSSLLSWLSKRKKRYVSVKQLAVVVPADPCLHKYVPK